MAVLSLVECSAREMMMIARAQHLRKRAVQETKEAYQIIAVHFRGMGKCSAPTFASWHAGIGNVAANHHSDSRSLEANHL